MVPADAGILTTSDTIPAYGGSQSALRLPIDEIQASSQSPKEDLSIG